ncbi:thiol-disulfide isomerase [Chryseobacterium angstadtii]|uniref:Thiol-disulfide isomerase n=1 Tax=Chryseobacterium angstadtii TaxID=558151 RepID=A0A0J7IFR6_9FLAO|nr:TlpA disulfide reductase family protein [Chryseobacterium angstadtii]KMQ64864.1 thiol-disulfide isomerase [Chryseobacterium angstadtii]
MNNRNYGIEGSPAPEWPDFRWIDANGKDIPPIHFKDYQGKFLVLFCFQSWCPGCHSSGFPSLQKMIDGLADNDDVKFLVVQTVFEGHDQNTFQKLKETQEQYGLKIPFGQDDGSTSNRNTSSIMSRYNNGGTPWFIFINNEGQVVFNDFHLNPEKAIEYLQSITNN